MVHQLARREDIGEEFVTAFDGVYCRLEGREQLATDVRGIESLLDQSRRNRIGYGPSRSAPRWRWITWESAVATLCWLAASGLFSWYAASFGKFNETYGSLGAVIGFMTWLWISAIVILLGAELDAEMEHQTARDTTTGAPKPLGVRGAKVADTVGAARAS